MGKESKIEWTHHTFNPWWGCTKISPGCANCYAETWAKRCGKAVWGDSSPRRFFGEKHWAEPKKWDAECAKKGIRERVFCASMADVFEDRPDLCDERQRLFELIDQTQHLDWLLLTKRPENIRPIMNEMMRGEFDPGRTFMYHMNNVWLGVTAENQEMWDKRVPILVSIPATVWFVSAEPLLGPITIGNDRPDWIIAGGESGPHARPVDDQWITSLRDQCQEIGNDFFFKQWGGTNKLATGRMLEGRTWDEVPEGIRF